MTDDKNSRVFDTLFTAMVILIVPCIIWAWVRSSVLRFWSLHHLLKVELIGLLLAIGILTERLAHLWNQHVDSHYQGTTIGPSPTSTYLGRNEKGKRIHIPEKARLEHTELIGTTGVGKTESVILNWAISDIERGSGLIIIDGKSDAETLDKFYAHVVRLGRASDFRLFSPANIDESSTFNPLLGGTPQEVAERVFAGFTFENVYYRDLQLLLFEKLLTLVINQGGTPTFVLIQRLLTDMRLLQSWLSHCQNDSLTHELSSFQMQSAERRFEMTSGLTSQLNHFTSGATSRLFNSKTSGILLEDVFSQGQICFFQLPTMYYRFLASATGKLLLLSIQNIISQRHLGKIVRGHFFSCFLDDFQDYMVPEFGALLNKSRSANVGVVLSHNSIGDLDKVGEGFRETITSCTNTKIVMRTNEPESADYMARFFGTRTTEKMTERRSHTVLGQTPTGEGSVREVEEYLYHPNQIKKLEVGEGIVSFPHFKGNHIMKIRFGRRESLPKVALPKTKKPELDLSALLTPPDTSSNDSGKVK